MSLVDLPGMPLRRSPEPKTRPSFVSTQVAEARRYYLNLHPGTPRELVVVCGGCERVRPDYVVERAEFPYLAIEFVAEGEGTLDLAGSHYVLRPGMVFAYGRETPHVIRNSSAKPMRKYYVDFAGASGQSLLAENPLGKWQPVAVAAPQELEEIFEWLQREATHVSPLAPRICAQLLTLLLTKITDLAVSGEVAEPRALQTYARIKTVMEKEFARLHSAEEIAQLCHVNVSYLCRLFQRFGHTTPYRFLTKLKMNRAAELLLDHGLMVKEVAAELRFADAFHFSRTFKRIYGVSPESFVRQNHR